MLFCIKVVRGGTLVVCPASLMQQWAGEVKKHCAPHALSVALHHGAARATQPQRLAVHDLVLTTYHILQREGEKVCANTHTHTHKQGVHSLKHTTIQEGDTFAVNYVFVLLYEWAVKN